MSNIILLEDNEEHFNRISDIVKKSGHNVFWNFDNVNKLITEFDAYKTCSPKMVERHRQEIEKLIKSIENIADIIWITDIDWLGNPKGAPNDYGLDFVRDFGKPERTILMSVNPVEKYRSNTQGLIYISKLDTEQNPFSNMFERSLKDAINNFEYTKKDTINNSEYAKTKHTNPYDTENN